MMNRGLRGVWIIVCLACMAAIAGAQASAVFSEGNGSVTMDATRLTTVMTLDAPWRFQPADDPRFADPDYDDSGWPLLQPGANRLLAASHVANEPEGNGWTRLHLHILKASGPLAFILTVRGETQYAVFANGKQIAATKGFATQVRYYGQSFTIALPQGQDVLLAIHFIHPGKPVIHYLPLEHFEIGQSEAVRNRTNLGRYAQFEDNSLGYLAVGAIYLAAAPFSLALLLAQRKHIEYLWLAIFCLLTVTIFWSVVPSSLGTVPSWFLHVSDVADSLQLIASIEFVVALAKVRRRWFIRIAELTALTPLLLQNPSLATQLQWSRAIGSGLQLSIIAYFLLAMQKRKGENSGLLLFPLMLLPISGLVAQAQDEFPAKLGPTWTGHLGGVGLTIYELASLLFIAWLMGVVLYRFIQVSKEEQNAASEFEAARTVQRLLIPATPPATPGFAVESVYLPAQQVGGDFFLVLPAQEGLQGTSLLAVMGDVSGKGLQAAMVVATIMGGLRTQISRAPTDVLSYLNRMLAGHVSGFVTCCAVLIHQDGRMQIANAGNPPPYCNGDELISSPALPLGLDPNAVYDETEHVLSVGSRLAFVSDGVVEATSFPRKELFGFDRTRATSTQSAQSIAERASLFGAGAPQADDITVLTITYTGF